MIFIDVLDNKENSQRAEEGDECIVMSKTTVVRHFADGQQEEST